MASKTKHIRKAISKVLEPKIRDLGYIGKYPNYQRITDNQLQILGIIYSKWGGALTIEFANSKQGDLETNWGEVIPEENITIEYIWPGERARLKIDKGDDFFSYEKIYDNYDKCEKLIQLLTSMLPQVDAWLKSGEVGSNIGEYSP